MVEVMTVDTTMGKITGSKETLNAISRAMFESARYNESKNHNAIAKINNEVCDQIYEALDKVGYYDNVSDQGIW